MKSSPTPTPDDRRKEEPETVYVNIWNADNGELKLSDQTSLFVDQLESIQQERQQDLATPTRVLWRPEYSEAVGGVGNSNQGDPPAPPSFVNNFYQNLRDNPDQELFQFVSNPQASLSVLSLRLTDPEVCGRSRRAMLSWLIKGSLVSLARQGRGWRRRSPWRA